MFAAVVALAEGCPIYRLRVTRDYERLGVVVHCIMKWHGGVGPPAASGVAFVFAPLRSVDLLPAIVLDGRRLLAQGGWLTARGPPSIV